MIRQRPGAPPEGRRALADESPEHSADERGRDHVTISSMIRRRIIRPYMKTLRFQGTGAF